VGAVVGAVVAVAAAIVGAVVGAKVGAVVGTGGFVGGIDVGCTAAGGVAVGCDTVGAQAVTRMATSIKVPSILYVLDISFLHFCLILIHNLLATVITRNKVIPLCLHSAGNRKVRCGNANYFR
jgi:hypothetical protein